MNIKSSIEALVAHGIPMQDIMASAILNGARDVVAEIAKIDPEAISRAVSWGDYTLEDGLNCASLMCSEYKPGIYRAYAENAAYLPHEICEVCYSDEEGFVPATSAMKIGIQVTSMLLVTGNPGLTTHLRENALEFISMVNDDLRDYTNDVLEQVNNDEELGWFFLNAMEVLIGSKIENAWTIAHPKPTEDTV